MQNLLIGLVFLPKIIYNDCSKLYAFCRVLDDLVDEEADLELKLKDSIKLKIFLNEYMNKMALMKKQ